MSKHTQDQLNALPTKVKKAAALAARHAQSAPKRRGFEVSPEQAFDAVVAAYLAEQAKPAQIEETE